LDANTTAINNSAFGSSALTANTAAGNSAFGNSALTANTSGTNNTAVGLSAGVNVSSGSNNTAIGANTSIAVATSSDQLNIGNNIFGTGLNGSVATPAGRIGIGTAAPTSTFHVNGSVSARIRAFDGTILADDYTILATGNVTLPAADANNLGRIYVISHNSSSGNVAINGTMRINGTGTFTTFNIGTGGGGGVGAITVQSTGASGVWQVTNILRN